MKHNMKPVAKVRNRAGADIAVTSFDRSDWTYFLAYCSGCTEEKQSVQKGDVTGWAQSHARSCSFEAVNAA